MECMCTQTRPQFIISSERGFFVVGGGGGGFVFFFVFFFKRGGGGGDGVRTHVNSKGKIPSTGNSPPRRIESTMLHRAGQRGQHTTKEPFRAPLCVYMVGYCVKSSACNHCKGSY